ncbi:hypothetical protein [Streptomyces sp. NPDC001966]
MTDLRSPERKNDRIDAAAAPTASPRPPPRASREVTPGELIHHADHGTQQGVTSGNPEVTPC